MIHARAVYNISIQLPRKIYERHRYHQDQSVKAAAQRQAHPVLEHARPRGQFRLEFYRGLEAKLAVAQRARKKNRVRAIHAKIANRRKDFLHQFSARLVRGYDTMIGTRQLDWYRIAESHGSRV